MKDGQSGTGQAGTPAKKSCDAVNGYFMMAYGITNGSGSTSIRWDSGAGLIRIIIHVMRDPPRTVQLALADQQVVEGHG